MACRTGDAACPWARQTDEDSNRTARASARGFMLDLLKEGDLTDDCVASVYILYGQRAANPNGNCVIQRFRLSLSQANGSRGGAEVAAGSLSSPRSPRPPV